MGQHPATKGGGDTGGRDVPILAVCTVIGFLTEVNEKVSTWGGTPSRTHGLSRLAIYLKRIKLGLIDPKPPFTIERQRDPATGSPRRGDVAAVTSATARDSFTVLPF